MAEAVRSSTSNPSSGILIGSNREQFAEQTHQDVKKNYDKVHADVKMALSMDEKGFTVKAIEFYQRALNGIAKALEIKYSDTDFVGETWDKVRSIQQKMRKTAIQIKSRLEALEKEFSAPSSAASSASSASANCYNPPLPANGATSRTLSQNGNCLESTSSGFSPQQQEDIEMNLALEEQISSLEPPSYEQAVEDAYELYNISEGVQIYFISSRGHVSTPSSPTSLKIYKFLDNRRGQTSGQPPAFLQVGDWLYPLVPGQSPALRSADGAYLFPDYELADEGACVGLILPPNLSGSQKAEFQRVINDLTALQTQTTFASEPTVRPACEPAVRPADAEEGPHVEQDQVGVSTKIAKGIETGASWLNWGLTEGAKLGGQLISKGSNKLKDHIQPKEEPKEIDERYQKGVVYARKATGAAVTVSRVVVDGLCYMTKRVGQEVAPVIREQTDKLLKKGGDDTDGKWGKRINGTVEVVGSGLTGFGVIYTGLEQAAKSLAKSIHGATVEVVQHRYGNSAAKLTDNSMATVGNVGLSYYNFNHLGVKAIAKRTAKDTGKALVEDYSKKPYKKVENETKKGT